MIDPLGGATAGALAQPSRTQLGREEFLELLVAQLRNQDPLSPLEPHQFAAQLAQFSSVEQLTTLNDGLALQTDMLQLGSLVDQTTLGASLLGRNVVTEGSQVAVTSSGGEVQVDIGGNGGDATVEVFDAAGRSIATVPIGMVGPGRQTLDVSAAPPGTYSYAVTVTDPSGQSTPVVTYTSGTVESVFFKSGEIFLRLGGIDVPLASIVEIEPAP